MRTLILLVSSYILSLAGSVGHAQGTIIFNNLGNTDPSPAAMANGLVFLQGGLLSQDINFELLAGSSGVALQPIHTWLVSDGSAKGIATGAGHFADPSGSIFTIPGVPVSGFAAVRIIAWAGNYPNVMSASLAGAPIGEVGFPYTAEGGGTTPASLDGMPALYVSVIPEPSSFTLGLVGVALLLLRSRSQVR